MARRTDTADTARLEAFSDGVFAIAVTLLVLDLHVPHSLPPGHRLAHALAQQWPTYAAYVTSFLTILVMWANHHSIFRHIQRSDNGLLFLNGLLLLVVTTVPFPTSLMAEYLRDPVNNRTAALVYSGMLLTLAVLFNVLWRYAVRGERLLGDSPDRRAVDTITRSYRFGPLVYLATFAAAFVNVPLCLALNLGLAVFFAFTGRSK